MSSTETYTVSRIYATPAGYRRREVLAHDVFAQTAADVVIARTGENPDLVGLSGIGPLMIPFRTANGTREHIEVRVVS